MAGTAGRALSAWCCTHSARGAAPTWGCRQGLPGCKQDQGTLDTGLQEKGRRQGGADRVHAVGCRRALCQGLQAEDRLLQAQGCEQEPAGVGLQAGFRRL